MEINTRAKRLSLLILFVAVFTTLTPGAVGSDVTIYGPNFGIGNPSDTVYVGSTFFNNLLSGGIVIENPRILLGTSARYTNEKEIISGENYATTKDSSYEAIFTRVFGGFKVLDTGHISLYPAGALGFELENYDKNEFGDFYCWDYPYYGEIVGALITDTGKTSRLSFTAGCIVTLEAANRIQSINYVGAGLGNVKHDGIWLMNWKPDLIPTVPYYYTVDSGYDMTFEVSSINDFRLYRFIGLNVSFDLRILPESSAYVYIPESYFRLPVSENMLYTVSAGPSFTF